MGAKKKIPIAAISEALEAAGGWMSQAAKMLKVSPATITRAVQGSKRLQEQLDSIKTRYLDIAETELLKKVKNGDLGAICFYLKCQGKDRGYIEKQYFATDKAEPLEIIVRDAAKCRKDT
jgi:hypothetical protein